MELDKKKTLILMVVAGVVLLGLLVISFVPFGKKEEADEGVTQTINDGVAQEMADSKSDAYRGLISTDDYFDQLGARMTDEEDISLVSSEPSASGTVFGDGASQAAAAETDDARVSRVFGEPPASFAPESRRSSSGGGASSRPMTQQERLDYDRQRAEMVRDVLAGASGEETLRSAQGDKEGAHGDREGAQGNGKGESEGGREILRFAQNDRRIGMNDSDGIVTSLDDDFEDAAVEYEGGKRPFKCMFVRDEKLKSGQRVTLRLLEDYNMDGVRIPANTHLAAICKIGDRLELQVRSLEMNGRIIPLALDAYDNDGLQGIYCPETSASKSSRQASNDAISTAGTTFGGLVGDLASTVIRTGASIARSASGEVSVSVVSGYEFYLVKSERR